MSADFKLSCLKFIYLFFPESAHFLVPSSWISLSILVGLKASEMLLFVLLFREGEEMTGFYLQSMSDKDCFAIKEANNKKPQVQDAKS